MERVGDQVFGQKVLERPRRRRSRRRRRKEDLTDYELAVPSSILEGSGEDVPR